MKEVTVRLVYPPDLLRVPVLNQLIQRFDLTVNILRARVSADAGWIELQIGGKEQTVDDALNWLRERGIYVQSMAAE